MQSSQNPCAAFAGAARANPAAIAYGAISGAFDDTWWLTIFHSPPSRMITQVIFTVRGSASSSTKKDAVPATLITSAATCAVLTSVNLTFGERHRGKPSK